MGVGVGLGENWGGVRIWGDFILKIADLTGLTGERGVRLGSGHEVGGGGSPGLDDHASVTLQYGFEGLQYTVIYFSGKGFSVPFL